MVIKTSSQPYGITTQSGVRLIPPIEGIDLPDTLFGVRVMDWALPKEGEAHLMVNPWLDRLSRVHPATPLVLYVPMVLSLIWRGLILHGLSVSHVLAWMLAGIFFWTFAEYSLHRGFFHFTPRSKLSLVLAYLIHGVHHAYPDDDRKLVMPPVFSLPVGFLFYGLFIVLMGRAYGDVFHAGFLLGYLCYDMTHYLVHAVPMRNHWGIAIKKNHMLHHFQMPNRRYGVSNTFWDYIFQTR
ncbi:MAG: sterol desaturase family protein [Elusimicrobia bacterium]|nr:sterol desaturase family protein [Elusimicrobiota bacterium]